MDDAKKCCHKWMEAIKAHRGAFFGVILIFLATLFTWASLDGLGILGMFIVGLCLVKHCSWKSNCPCPCSCCQDNKCSENKGECSDKKDKK